MGPRYARPEAGSRFRLTNNAQRNAPGKWNMAGVNRERGEGTNGGEGDMCVI